MKHNKYPQHQNPGPNGESCAEADKNLALNEIDFTHFPDEVARRAYFCYLNRGSLDGHDVQHWLEAEAQLLVERALRRVHGAHNPT